MSESITAAKLASIGGMAYEVVSVAATINIPKCIEQKTWPDGMPVPDNIPMPDRKVYKKSARECATELGTTPRQISKLRAGRIKEAKPLNWYSINNKPMGI